MATIRWQLVGDAPQGALFEPDGDVLERRPGEGRFAGMEFLHVRARRIINEVPAAARMPFRFTINAYRGCSHACTYCFARPTHEYLGMNAGEDFDRRIVVKVNAVECVRRELASPRWGGDEIAMGTNTDPYQRCEGKYRLTRGIVEALAHRRNPFSVLTKSTLILRDLDVLAAAAASTSVRANFSIGTLDEALWRASEPGTPHPARRVEAVARLNEAGVPCGVLIGPVLPGLSDAPDQLEALVRACTAAGAASVSAVLLHLRPGVREEFMPWLARTYPHLVPAYERLYRKPYAPKANQEALSALVARLAARHRRRTRAPQPPQPPRPTTARAPGPGPDPTPATAHPTVASVAAAANQLSLGV